MLPLTTLQNLLLMRKKLSLNNEKLLTRISKSDCDASDSSSLSSTDDVTPTAITLQQCTFSTSVVPPRDYLYTTSSHTVHGVVMDCTSRHRHTLCIASSYHLNRVVIHTTSHRHTRVAIHITSSCHTLCITSSYTLHGVMIRIVHFIELTNRKPP